MKRLRIENSMILSIMPIWSLVDSLPQRIKLTTETQRHREQCQMLKPHVFI